MGLWTLVLRDQAGCELRIAIDETIEAMPGGTQLDMRNLRYLGVWSEGLGTDVCGVTIPTEQEAFEYLTGTLGGTDNPESATRRFQARTRPDQNFRRIHRKGN